MRGGGVVADLLGSIAATVQSAAAVPALKMVAEHLEVAHHATAAATEWLLERSNTDPEDALAGASAYLEMLAVTTAGQALADGAVAAAAIAGFDEGFENRGETAADRAVLARAFAANRLARVPGMLAAVTVGSADLRAARTRLLTGC